MQVQRQVKTEAALLGVATPRKAALLRGKSIPPAEGGSRILNDRLLQDHRLGNAVNARLAVNKARRDVPKTRRQSEPVAQGGTIAGEPGAVNDLRGDRTNGSNRWTPRTNGNACPRARVYRGHCSDQGQARANHDFRYHGFVVILYIYAHHHAPCNTDCYRVPACTGLRRLTPCGWKPFADFKMRSTAVAGRSSVTISTPRVTLFDEKIFMPEK